MFKLRGATPVLRNTRPIIRPRLILIGPQTDHRFNCKRHPGLRHPHRLILRIMRHIRRAMKQTIHPMAAVRFDDAATSTLGVFFNHGPRVAESHARFDELDGFVEAFAGGFDDADGGRIRAGKWAYVVCFVEVAVEAVVVEGDIEVDDVAFEEDALVGDAVTDYFIDGGADGFGEIDVV